MVVMLNESPWVKSNTDIRVAMEERFAHLKRGMPRSTIIYTQNEPAEYLHFLLEGRVNVFLLNRSGELKT
jgi:CRP-like cAMP-binding protein